MNFAVASKKLSDDAEWLLKYTKGLALADPSRDALVLICGRLEGIRLVLAGLEDHKQLRERT